MLHNEVQLLKFTILNSNAEPFQSLSKLNACDEVQVTSIASSSNKKSQE
jgi:hypothetical protein